MKPFIVQRSTHKEALPMHLIMKQGRMGLKYLVFVQGELTHILPLEQGELQVTQVLMSFLQMKKLRMSFSSL